MKSTSRGTKNGQVLARRASCRSTAIGSLSAHYERASSTRIARRRLSGYRTVAPMALLGGGCSCRRRTLTVSNRNDDSCPSPNFLAAVIPLIHVACNRHLHNYLIEPVADKASHRELALLLVARRWRT